MSAKSGIEWTEATWNPTVGCTKVSPGCDHCYAETLVNRFAGSNKGFPNRFDVMTIRDDEHLTLPTRWRKPRRIFVNSLSDLFHDDVPDVFIARVFAVMAAAPRHTFQLLTKRHGRMRSLLNSESFQASVDKHTMGVVAPHHGMPVPVVQWPLPNLWLGVSAEDQQRADLRIPALMGAPAAVRWVSAEPLLGRLNLRSWLHDLDDEGEPICQDHGVRECWQKPGCMGLDWVVVGGESGASARPMLPDWVRDLRTQCENSATAFLFKQWGGRTAKANGRELDGQTWDAYPEPKEAIDA